MVEARNCTPTPAPKTFSENLTEHEVYTFVVATKGGQLIGNEVYSIELEHHAFEHSFKQELFRSARKSR